MEGPSVLIVDGEKNVRLTLSRALEALEVETDTAANGEEALARMEERDFDLILLDLRLPGMDGMELLETVRRTKPGTGVVVVTAYGTIELAVEAMKLGALDFIQKPVSPSEIRQLVCRVLGIGKEGKNQGATL